MAGVARTQSPSDRRRTMATRLLFVNTGFVNEHHRDLVPDRIEPVARDAPETAVVRLQLHLRPAGGAYQYLEQIRADSHGKPLSLAGRATIMKTIASPSDASGAQLPIRVALNHKTIYRYDRRVTLSPQV